MSEYIYHLGDLVIQKSGRPIMAVPDIVKVSDVFNYKTSWLQDGQQQISAFPEK